MASLKQIEANRRNAQKSTGPKDKEAVRCNALKSGVHAVLPVIPGEDPEEFKSFADALTRSANAADEREHVLVGQMVYFGWRLRRLMQAETQSWTRTFEFVEALANYREDTKLADSFKICEQTHLRLQRLIASVQKSYRQAAADLDRLQAARSKSPQPQVHQHLNPEIGFVPSTCVNQAAEFPHVAEMPAPIAIRRPGAAFPIDPMSPAFQIGAAASAHEANRNRR